MNIFRIPSVYAQSSQTTGSKGLFEEIFGGSGEKIGGVGTGIPQIITNVLKFATGFAIIICVAILIFAGYTYMTAGGDEGKIQTATKSLTWAIIGLVLSLVVVMLIKFVSDKILGPNLIEGL